MQRSKPPFRADMVGSLLRTRSLKEARQKHQRGEISDQDLKAVEDQEIRALIKRQEEIGLQAVSDGEFRRAYWHFDFLEHLDGVTLSGDGGFALRGAGRARDRPGGNGEAGKKGALDCEGFSRRREPGACLRLQASPGGMVENARIAAVEGAEEMDDVGKIARRLWPGQERRAGGVGVGAASLLGHAREQPIADSDAACGADRN